jgi:hypothetical protein
MKRARPIFNFATEAGLRLRCFLDTRTIEIGRRFERARLQPCRNGAKEVAALAAEGWF